MLPEETSLKHNEPQMLDSNAYAMQSLKGRRLAALTKGDEERSAKRRVGVSANGRNRSAVKRFAVVVER